jgi:hypothetical protein
VGSEAREKLFGEDHFTLDWGLRDSTGGVEPAALAGEMRRRIVSYEETCEVAVGVMAAGGHYASERQARAFGELLELLGSPPGPNGTFFDPLNKLQVYPALLLLYAGGIAATAMENWPFLRTLMRDSVFTDHLQDTGPTAVKVYPWVIDAHKELTNLALFVGQPKYEPTSMRLFETLREPLENYLSLQSRYQEAFHRFEALLALTYVDINKRQEPDYHDWVSLAQFAVLHKKSRGRDSDLSTLRSEYDEQRAKWGPITAGLLKEPAPSDRGIPTIDSVAYDFDVVEAMIGKMSYF